LRVKEQEICLTLHEHDDDDDEREPPLPLSFDVSLFVPIYNVYGCKNSDSSII
jgi:hypothetical protein